MDKNKSLLIAAIIFGIVAILHLLRIIFSWEAAIGGFNIPLYFSYIAVVVAGYLAWNMYKASAMK
ncbi:MAG: hypothetical protein Q8R04_07690 [Nanoarchaeota archaeon]|nr:hypothetical protein [Nanoarchaeota archaeon]